MEKLQQNVDERYIPADPHEPLVKAVAILVPTGVRFPRWWKWVTGDKTSILPSMKIPVTIGGNQKRYIAVGFTARGLRGNEAKKLAEIQTHIYITQLYGKTFEEESQVMFMLIVPKDLTQMGDTAIHELLEQVAELAATMLEEQVS